MVKCCFWVDEDSVRLIWISNVERGISNFEGEGQPRVERRWLLGSTTLLLATLYSTCSLDIRNSACDIRHSFVFSGPYNRWWIAFIFSLNAYASTPSITFLRIETSSLISSSSFSLFSNSATCSGLSVPERYSSISFSIVSSLPRSSPSFSQCLVQVCE